MKKDSITAIIPVREGSRRLKNKNIAPFAGSNLLVNKIKQLKEVQ
jgi:N-acylneuraminate cytidylyltransferase